MNFTIAGNSALMLSMLVFVAVLLLLEGVYLMWRAYKGPEATKLQKRLRALSAAGDITQQAQLLKQRMLSEVPLFERILLDLPRAHQFERYLMQAGLSWTVSKLLLFCAALCAIVWMVLVSLAHQPVLIGALGGVFAGALPLLYVQRHRRRRLAKLEQQLPEALDLIARALRSGHAFATGMQMIGDEMPEPIASEFRIVHDEVNFGVSLQQALTNLSERVPITDLRYFVVAVLIQRDSGGNLTEVLGNLSRLIRARLKLLARVRVLSSEGRLSAWILGLMPFGLAGLMNIFNPEFMSPLWKDPIGIQIVKYTLILMAVGVLILRKIIRIRI